MGGGLEAAVSAGSVSATVTAGGTKGSQSWIRTRTEDAKGRKSLLGKHGRSGGGQSRGRRPGGEAEDEDEDDEDEDGEPAALRMRVGDAPTHGSEGGGRGPGELGGMEGAGRAASSGSESDEEEPRRLGVSGASNGGAALTGGSLGSQHSAAGSGSGSVRSKGMNWADGWGAGSADVGGARGMGSGSEGIVTSASTGGGGGGFAWGVALGPSRTSQSGRSEGMGGSAEGAGGGMPTVIRRSTVAAPSGVVLLASSLDASSLEQSRVIGRRSGSERRRNRRK